MGGSMNETDEVLYEKYLDVDDQGAFATLYDRHQKSLTVFLYTVVGSMEDAEELMLDTFAVAASGTTRFGGKHGAAFKTWLYGIAKNKARMYMRKQKPSHVPLNDEIISSGFTPENKVMEDERHEKLYHALASIPDDYREALYLTYFEQMKPEDISSVMRKTKKQIYNLIARGKQALKAALKVEGIHELYDDN